MGIFFTVLHCIIVVIVLLIFYWNNIHADTVIKLAKHLMREITLTKNKIVSVSLSGCESTNPVGVPFVL